MWWCKSLHLRSDAISRMGGWEEYTGFTIQSVSKITISNLQVWTNSTLNICKILSTGSISAYGSPQGYISLVTGLPYATYTVGIYIGLISQTSPGRGDYCPEMMIKGSSIVLYKTGGSSNLITAAAWTNSYGYYEYTPSN